MKLTSAGESHGKALVGIIENVPSNLKIDIEKINFDLQLRQSGYGRGARQKIERDEVEIISGVRNYLTLASPLCFSVKNADYENWKNITGAKDCDITKRVVTCVRPGHADLTGLIKYDKEDARDILERASARETAVRVVAGNIAKQFLRELNINISGYVKCVCGIKDDNIYTFDELQKAKTQPLFMLNEDIQNSAMQKIDELKSLGDTAGGIIEIRVNNIKSGFGSCMTYDSKLDGILAGAVMSVQAIKGVEFGLGFECGERQGSYVHDEIYYNDDKFFRKTNNAGGIEGGMSNGEDIIIRAVMKPIPTLMRGLKTVDYITKEQRKADTERSDVSAICACEIVVENVVALALSEVIQKRLGGDNMREIIERYNNLR